MSIQDQSLPALDPLPNQIRMRTLVFLRWVAILGQIIAITVAQRAFGLVFEVGFAYLAIGLAVVGNLVAIFIYPENKRLSEAEALMMLLFDLLQLSFLLAVTGGLSNPFALLILAPVTIAASLLPARDTVVLGGLAIIIVSALALWSVPLQTAQGFELRMPEIFVFGFWTAIVIGVLFLGFYARRVTEDSQTMSQALLATQMALSREQKLTDLGGVVAAAAHELGTPLATIKLVSSELKDELEDRPDLLDDVSLIRAQADRCRDILRSMGRAGKDDTHLRRAPLETVVREAAEPHLERGKDIEFHIGPRDGANAQQPNIHRKPEIIHGLRNLIQNAVDFAESTVEVDVNWYDDRVYLRIMDDGRGFDPRIIGRIGDPFVRRRKPGSEDGKRPGYEGMGLGLFIAKTLLERAGAELSFSNRGDPSDAKSRGAVVEVVWSRDQIEAEPTTTPLGENPRMA